MEAWRFWSFAQNKLAVVRREWLGKSSCTINHSVNLSDLWLLPWRFWNVMFKPPTQGFIFPLSLLAKAFYQQEPSRCLTDHHARVLEIGDYITNTSEKWTSLTLQDHRERIACLAGMLHYAELGEHAAIVLEDADLENAATNRRCLFTLLARVVPPSNGRKQPG